MKRGVNEEVGTEARSFISVIVWIRTEMPLKVKAEVGSAEGSVTANRFCPAHA
eukprot:IDg16490t1